MTRARGRAHVEGALVRSRAMDDMTELDATATAEPDTLTDEALIDDELLVEEISIDGMCGVY